MASTRAPQFTAPNAIVALADRPASETFTLPDLTPVRFEEDDQTHHLTVKLGTAPEAKPGNSHARFARSKEEQEQSLKPLLEFVPTGRKVSTSPEQVNEDRRIMLEVAEMKSSNGHTSFKDLWSGLYAFWVRRDEHDRYPILVGNSFPNRVDVVRYLVQCGLGFQVRGINDNAENAEDTTAITSFDVILDRSAFWQGAGAPKSRTWLRAEVPDPREFGDVMMSEFPLVSAFTRSSDPPVLATHPLRPPKPIPGSIVYSRYVHATKQHYQLSVIDWRNEEHFKLYTAWQNSDRVNHGWKERGPDEHHRKFLQGRERDPHTMGLISSWDGEYAGYGEASWSKEDGVSAFVGGLGDYDQGTHSFVGEEKFRGRHRFAHNMISLKHFCFLRDARTNIVIGEPRYDLAVVPLLAAYLPQSVRKEVELPHKRAVFFILHRDRFFSEAMFY